MYDVPQLNAEGIAAFTARVATMPAASDDSERIDRIRRLEELKGAVAAAQAVETAAFAASQRTANLNRGLPVARADRGVAAQIALADESRLTRRSATPAGRQFSRPSCRRRSQRCGPAGSASGER